MLTGALMGLVLAACPARYEQIRSVLIEFPEGSAQLSQRGRAQISEFLTPLLGNEMAEVSVEAYFPYGERNMSNADAPALSDFRVREVRNAAVELGVSVDLVGTGVTAMNWDGDDSPSGGFRRPVERLHQVEMESRVKTDCHPLAELARRMNPYR